jgi:hypothetical protein
MKQSIPSLDAVFLLGNSPVEKITIHRKTIYRLFVWVLLIGSILILVHLAPTLSKPEYLPSDDFIPFWTGGKLNLQGENPFDPQKIEQLQIDAGGQASGTYTISIMLNPPWTVALVMPFGLLNYQISRLAWLIVSVLLVLLSSQLLWRIYAGIPNQRWLAILVVFIFAPTISVLEVGQITAFVLLGITGFLYFNVSKRNDWLAGVFLALASIKPQVAFIFWIALLFWIIQQHRWIIILSISVTILSLTSIALIFNPHIIQQYIFSLQTYQMLDWASPTIGAYLRFFWFGSDKFLLQFLPPLLGIFWFIYDWFRHYKSWNWANELPLLLLISQITTWYTWTYDQVILVPAIIQAEILLLYVWKRWSGLILAVIFLGINLFDLILHMKLSDFWFIWMAPTLLLWFLLVRWQYGNPKGKGVSLLTK